MEVGNRIREERDRLGISQEELSRKVFVSRQTVSNWETGKTYPDVQSLLLLSSLFDVSIDSLVKGDVEAMKEQLENYEMERFKIKASAYLSLALIVLGATMLAILVAQGISLTSPLGILALLVLVAAVGVSYTAERIERKYDIDTMREVQAFLDGTDPAEIERERKYSKVALIVIRLAFGAAAGALLMVVLSALMALTMF